MATEGMNTLTQRVDRLIPPEMKKIVPAPVPRDIMIDIESLSLRPNALVLSIGACMFTCSEAEGPIIGEKLLLVPDITEQLLAGRHVDPDTQKWWAQKENEAASEHWRVPNKIVPMRLVLAELADFCRGAPRIWANGICFDITVIEDLYRAEDRPAPWKYNVIRDARTFYDNNRPWRPLHGGDTTTLVPHHPVDDCIGQINRLWEAGFDR